MRTRLLPALTALIVVFALPPLAANDNNGQALGQLLKSSGSGNPAVPAATGTAVSAPSKFTDAERQFITAHEKIRIDLLSAALPKVMDLIQGIEMGDTHMVISGRTGRPTAVRGWDPGALRTTLRAAQKHLNVRPYSLERSTQPADIETLETLHTAARLMSENLAKMLPKEKSSVSTHGPDAIAANEGSQIVLFPDFWVADKPPYFSPSCPGIILIHEYFHHLVVNPEQAASAPSQTMRVFHGEPSVGAPTFAPEGTKYALCDAYSLTSFVVEVALGGDEIECSPGWKPTVNR